MYCTFGDFLSTTMQSIYQLISNMVLDQKMNYTDNTTFPSVADTPVRSPSICDAHPNLCKALYFLLLVLLWTWLFTPLRARCHILSHTQAGTEAILRRFVRRFRLLVGWRVERIERTRPDVEDGVWEGKLEGGTNEDGACDEKKLETNKR